MKRSDLWKNRFIDLAKHYSTWSRDPSTNVGAVVVDSSKRILSVGYNGFPRGIEDTEERLNHRPTKYRLTVHAEMNCIYNAAHNGTSLNGADIYVWGLPTCSECAKGLIQIGIKRVFVCHPETIGEKWIDEEILSKEMYKEAGVVYNKTMRKT